ncbi:MAG: 5-(carboxyamino)imidazole ribonucleotide synthase [Pseudomonadota bacterium]
MITLGIVGAGQLGRMLAHAGWDLGIRCVFLDPADAPPARGLGPIHRAPFDDIDALHALATEVDVLTFEFENLSAEALARLPSTTPIHPPTRALAIAQSRRAEKRQFEALGIAVAPWRPVDSQADLEHAADALGLPLVVKLDRLGYDGRGQEWLREPVDVVGCFNRFNGAALVAEQRVPFDREVSQIACRSVAGDLALYPLTENQHRDGILYRSVVAPMADELTQAAAEATSQLAAELEYVGTLTVEFFVVGDRLIANEMAPRVHNSGHWTIEGATTSQFENHLRAVCDLPLGATRALGPVGMRNFVGSLPRVQDVLALPGVRFHGYDKPPRPGRKLGHATVLDADYTRLLETFKTLDERFPWGGGA